MQWKAGLVAGAARIASVCLLAGGLGGCYTLGKGGESAPAARPVTLTAPPAPAPFTALNSTVSSQAVVSDIITNRYTNNATFTPQTGATPRPVTIDSRGVAVQGTYALRNDNARFESNGSSVRGALVNDPQTWATVSNAPGSRLDASLGSSSLEHAYAGTGMMGPLRAGTTGDSAFQAFGFFGGRATGDMPNSGRAEYAGGFEGLEHSALTGQTMQTSNISGKANVSADFAAKTVRGRIDDVNNHSVGPMPQPAGYSIGFTGAISNSLYAGSSWITQRNSDAPLAGAVQNTGVVQGGFFGPGAVETAGGISVTTADANRKLLVTGGFGAKKK